MGMVEEKLFERKKNKNESEREEEKWMQGGRESKQAGRTRTALSAPGGVTLGFFLVWFLIGRVPCFSPSPWRVRRRVGASFAALPPQPAAHPAPDNEEREFRLQSCFSEPHPRTRLRGR